MFCAIGFHNEIFVPCSFLLFDCYSVLASVIVVVNKVREEKIIIRKRHSPEVRLKTRVCDRGAVTSDR